MISKETEERLALSILRAYLARPPVPWGITLAGWNHYVNHWSKKVRYAAMNHPACPEQYKSRVIPFKLARESLSSAK